jgi:hypothetical protein
MSRIVCWFSCGVASAVATKLAIAQYGKENIVIARCIVREEHTDNDRFANDCAEWFGMPIKNLINQKYDGSVYEVIKQRGYISGINGAPCTLHLKKELRISFQLPTDKHIFGYCAEEQSRWDDFLDANNIDAESPLIDRGLEHSDCLAIIQDVGIEIPTMYKLRYKHNNCIGCTKSTGQGYWNKIRNDFPHVFDYMAKESRRLNVRMIRIENERCFLDELVPGTGDYQSEPEIQCGIFCEMAKSEISYEI